MQTAYSGNTDKFRAGEYEYDINIKYNDRKALMMSNLIMNERGEQIKLITFASSKRGSDLAN
jgi:HAE1 family hydrophobic/amphiphilic exporter-1